MFCSVEPTRKPNRLVVDDNVGQEDATIVIINTKVMDTLNIFKGDPVLIKGKRRRETVCVCLPDDTCPEGTIRLTRNTRTNLRCRISDVVTVLPCPDTQFGKNVLILPYDDSIEGISGNLFEVYIKPYFLEAYRPVHEGDMITCRGAMRSVDFQIIKCDPSPFCIVSPDTVIHCDGNPVQREVCENIYLFYILYFYLNRMIVVKQGMMI
jgi:transitional endoplasmic reticulum ATPase